MRGNLHRYRVSPSRKKNRMLQGTFLPSYSPVLKNAGYGLLLTLLCVFSVILRQWTWLVVILVCVWLWGVHECLGCYSHDMITRTDQWTRGMDYIERKEKLLGLRRSRVCILSYSTTVDMTGCDIGVCVCVCRETGVFTSVWGVILMTSL